MGREELWGGSRGGGGGCWEACKLAALWRGWGLLDGAELWELEGTCGGWQ